MNEVIYLAGGCLWGVQAFVKTLPGVVETEAGRANGSTHDLDGQYDGYVECVKTTFDSNKVSAKDLTGHLFEIIDPYSRNQQCEDIEPKYRTGVYSEQASHLEEAKEYIQNRPDRNTSGRWSPAVNEFCSKCWGTPRQIR